MPRCPSLPSRGETRGLQILVALLVLVFAGRALALSSPSGAEVFRKACASCHGADGRGTPLPLRGFFVEPPDLTDCNFSTREAVQDWETIVREGGPSRGFDRMMPSFAEALSPEELRAAVLHARSFCDETSWPRGDLNLPRPIFTEKAFVEDEVVLTSSIAAAREGSIANKLIVEKRILSRGQLEAVLPFAWRQGEDTVWRGGIGDIALGGKAVLLANDRWGSILSVGGETILPTGNKERGLGAGLTRFEPFVLFGQILPKDFYLYLQVGAEIPTRPEEVPVELFWRAAVGLQLRVQALHRSLFPAVEILGARELEEAAPTSWDVVPQLQVPLSRRQHIRLSIGARIPLTDFSERHVAACVFLLWDYFDGGLLEGF